MTELALMASPDVTSAGDLLVLPLGATEQHGPHLPLCTDTAIAEALAARLSAWAPEVVIAPTIPYGSSGEHQAFAGTISIGRDALEAVLIEFVRSAGESFGRVLFLNAHGGNTASVARAVGRLRAEGHDVRSWSPAAVWHGDAHAGHVETSVMLALGPDKVHVERAAAGNTTALATLMPELTRVGVRAVSENGVLGDPRAASAAYGRALVDVATVALVTSVWQWPSTSDVRR